MSNPLWEAIVADFKAGVINVEQFINKIEAIFVAEEQQLGGLLSALLTAEENQIAVDFYPDLKQIAVNIQNSTEALSITTFFPIFIAAATPVVIQEGVTLSEVFWNVVTTYHASNLGITSTPGNNGNVGS